MKTAVSSLRWIEPCSLRDALEILHNDPVVRPAAGCTDLYVDLNFGKLKPTQFLNVWSLTKLRTVRKKGRGLSIGALATYSDLIRSPLVQRHAPILASASREVGGVQIQNRGTLGGNVANASPAGDTLPVLSVLDATIVLESVRGVRRVPFDSFYVGYRKSVMEPDELITAIELPGVDGPQWFRKVGTRAAQAISKIVMAATFEPTLRVAIGSVAPTVVRAPKVETAWQGGASPEELARVLEGEIAPIDDLRSTGAYRRRVAANLLLQCLRSQPKRRAPRKRS